MASCFPGSFHGKTSYRICIRNVSGSLLWKSVEIIRTLLVSGHPYVGWSCGYQPGKKWRMFVTWSREDGAEKTRSWYLGFWFMNSRPRPPLSSQYLTVIGSLQTASELVQVYDILVSRILTVELNSHRPEVAQVDIKYSICSTQGIEIR